MQKGWNDGCNDGETADLELIQRIIPHRYPFLLIDKVRDIVLNESCVGIKCITLNEPQFQGHFPGMPIFPGVMIIEAMAQTSGILVGLSMDLVDKNAKVFFIGRRRGEIPPQGGAGRWCWSCTSRRCAAAGGLEIRRQGITDCP